MATRWTKDVTRVIAIPGREDVLVTLTRTGISFRYPRKRFTIEVSYGLAMANAESNAGREAIIEKEKKKLLK